MGSYKSIAIDFDGVIAQYDGWKGIGVFGEPIAGVAAALQNMRDAGLKIIIHTTRGETEDLASYLERHRIPYDHINRNPQNFSYMNQGKPIADVYVDDRAVCFEGRWDSEFIDRLLQHIPWYMRKNCKSVSDILGDAKDTYQDRQSVYQDSYVVHGSVMADLFAEGIALKTPKEFARYALVNMIVGKLIRYTRSLGDMHKDSIHDLMVYAAMLQEVDGMEGSRWDRDRTRTDTR